MFVCFFLEGKLDFFFSKSFLLHLILMWLMGFEVLGFWLLFFKAGVDGKGEKMRMRPTRFQIYWEQNLKQSMQHHES